MSGVRLRVRAACVLSAVIGVAMPSMGAAAPVTQTAPYTTSEVVEKTAAADVTGLGAATVDARSDSTTGFLRTEASASTTAPAGTFIPGIDLNRIPPVYGGTAGVGASYARGFSRIVHYFPVAAAGPVTVSAQVTNITASASTTYTQTVVNGICLCDIWTNGYAYARIKLDLYVYGCDILGGQVCPGRTAFSEMNAPGTGNVTINGTVTAIRQGWLVVKVGAASEALAKGNVTSQAQLTGTVASITKGP